MSPVNRIETTAGKSTRTINESYVLNKCDNNSNVKQTRISSTDPYGGTPWSMSALSTGNGIGSDRSISPPSVSKLKLPIVNIIECNDKLVIIMAEAVKSTQELKNRLSSAHTREQVFMTLMLHDQSHDQS
jgi:hypothetical protein